MQARLDEGRAAGEGRRPSSPEQALRSLLAGLAETDLEAQAQKSGGVYAATDSPAGLDSPDATSAATSSSSASDITSDPPNPVPGESVTIDLLDGSYVITRQDVIAVRGEPPTVWVKILLLIYLTRAGGRPETGTWTAYRDLPNSVSKARSFEECAARIASAFEGDPEGLERAVRGLGGWAVDPGPADRAFLLRALPRVPLMLLFWDREEEFPARAGLLLDGSVGDYLDLEALLFVGEVVAGRLLGETLADVVA